MPVTEEEAERLIGVIINTIGSTPHLSDNLIVSDLVSQWRSEVEAGRQIEKKLKVRENPRYQFDSGPSKSRPESSGEFIGRDDYKQIERLNLLINTVNLIFVVPEKMAFNVFDTIKRIKSEKDEEESDNFSIFLAGIGDGGEPKLEINQESIAEWGDEGEALAKLVREISGEISSKARLDLIDEGN